MLIYRQKGNWLNIVIYYENKIKNVTAQYICDEKTTNYITLLAYDWVWATNLCA